MKDIFQIIKYLSTKSMIALDLGIQQGIKCDPAVTYSFAGR